MFGDTAYYSGYWLQGIWVFILPQIILFCAFVLLVLFEKKLIKRNVGLIVFTLLLILSVTSFLQYRRWNITFVHLHDSAHYYMGGKYLRHVGYFNFYIPYYLSSPFVQKYVFNIPVKEKNVQYPFLSTNLYTCTYGWKEHRHRRLKNEEFNDLTPRIKYFARVLSKSGYLNEYLNDINNLKQNGLDIKNFLSDLGFNGTVFWSFLQTLCNPVFWGPVTLTKLKFIVLFEYLSIFSIILIICKVFGYEYGLLTGISFFAWPTNGWIMGSIFRLDWLIIFFLSICALEKKWYILSGLLMAVSCLIKPIILLPAAGIFLHFLLSPSTRDSNNSFRILLSFFLFGTLFFVISGISMGFDKWWEWVDKIYRHRQSMQFNFASSAVSLNYFLYKIVNLPVHIAFHQLLSVLAIILCIITCYAKRIGDVNLFIFILMASLISITTSSHYYFVWLCSVFFLLREKQYLLIKAGLLLTQISLFYPTLNMMSIPLVIFWIFLISGLIVEGMFLRKISKKVPL